MPETYDGKLIESLMNTVQLDAYTATRPLRDTEPRISVSFYVSTKAYDRLKETARECGTSLSEFCRVAVAFYLEHLETEDRI